MERKRILFVCLGNICRSPVAEAVFRHYVAEAGLSDCVDIDSAGTSGYHQGELADPRMRAHAQLRGYVLTSRSRQLCYEDFFTFDYIIGMDEQNRRDILALAPTSNHAAKVSLLTDWHPNPSVDHVPDPYYGGAQGFDHVLDLVEACSRYLLEALAGDSKLVEP